jgi:hypothetical protein
VDITVKVKIGNVEVELTLEEAAELHAALGRITGKPEDKFVPVPCGERIVYLPSWRECSYARRYVWPYDTTWISNSGSVSLTVTSTSGNISGTGSISWGR